MFPSDRPTYATLQVCNGIDWGTPEGASACVSLSNADSVSRIKHPLDPVASWQGSIKTAFQQGVFINQPIKLSLPRCYASSL